MRKKALLITSASNWLFVLVSLIELIESIQAIQIVIEFKQSEASSRDMIISTSVCLGSLFSQCFKMHLDFSSQMVFVVDYGNKDIDTKNKFIFENSDTFEMINEKLQWNYRNTTLQGYQGRDQLAFGYHDNKDMMLIFGVLKSNMCQIIGNDSGIDGIIGLGITNNNKRHNSSSIIHQVYNQFLIDHTLFYILNDNNSKSLLNIGSLPDIVYNDYTHYGSCNVTSSSFSMTNTLFAPWQCSIKITSYNPYYFEYVNDKVIFDYNKKYISPPYYLIDNLWRMFNEQDYNEICTRVKINNGNQMIKCTKEPSHYFVIKLAINDWSIKIPIEEIVKDETRDDKDDIVLYFDYNNNDNWILGYDYLKHVTVVFDNDNGIVNFYHPKWVEYKGKAELSKPVLPIKNDSKRGTNNKSETNRKMLFLMKTLFLIPVVGIVFIIIIRLSKLNNNIYLQ